MRLIWTVSGYVDTDRIVTLAADGLDIIARLSTGDRWVMATAPTDAEVPTLLHTWARIVHAGGGSSLLKPGETRGDH